VNPLADIDMLGGEGGYLSVATGTQALGGFLSSPMRLRGKYESVLVAGDVALCSLRWEMLDPDGWIDQDGLSVEVLKRGADGKWRFAIDDATGASRERD
jgi:ketosteroid isomerase-like protein